MTDSLVLIADNDVAVNSLLAELLQGRGLQCEMVHDGEAALARLQQGGVRVLVTDLDMPGLSGQELLARMTDLSPLPDVVVASGFIDAAVEADLARYPFVREVLRKPFDVMAFTDLVAGLVAGPAEGSAEGSAEDSAEAGQA